MKGIRTSGPEEKVNDGRKEAIDNDGDECDSAAGEEERPLGSTGHAPDYITSVRASERGVARGARVSGIVAGGGVCARLRGCSGSKARDRLDLWSEWVLRFRSDGLRGVNGRCSCGRCDEGWWYRWI